MGAVTNNHKTPKLRGHPLPYALSYAANTEYCMTTEERKGNMERMEEKEKVIRKDMEG